MPFGCPLPRLGQSVFATVGSEDSRQRTRALGSDRLHSAWAKHALHPSSHSRLGAATGGNGFNALIYK